MSKNKVKNSAERRRRKELKRKKKRKNNTHKPKNVITATRTVVREAPVEPLAQSVSDKILNIHKSKNIREAANLIKVVSEKK